MHTMPRIFIMDCDAFPWVLAWIPISLLLFRFCIVLLMQKTGILPLLLNVPVWSIGFDLEIVFD